MPKERQAKDAKSFTPGFKEKCFYNFYDMMQLIEHGFGVWQTCFHILALLAVHPGTSYWGLLTWKITQGFCGD